MKDIIDDVKVIYREDDEGLEIENIIFEKILKKGVWVLYGKKDGIYECLNVGKSINVGSEILYDIACLKFATVYKGNIIKNLIMDCQSYTKYRPNETTGGIFVSWRRKEELPTGA